MRRSVPAALALPAAADSSGQATLLGRAVLPAKTFAPGPPSGSLLGSSPINGVPVPFASQPVQGFSAALPAGEGRYRVMPDNGYGSIENSSDFDLRIYLINPKLETAQGGPGTIDVVKHRNAHHPDADLPVRPQVRRLHRRPLVLPVRAKGRVDQRLPSRRQEARPGDRT